ncbi:(2Fe-2S)-binding protein [Pseudonocardia sp. KRD-184]|uniref:(2Fe-2S)-binding protein n=1 Tax=Pseudonocardia oceani TaxID=2792013 RepID=A0ABS6UAM4_9PSEU|nr:(2Fe-2S)-binding protein [Pseudonocardia oceani]MBW0088931.1 (2Fe-2S)-binding protein [Pseudonocardia oceani]MBW0096082.1 (2Fe-2S)-binding protein [Pseudonocardia oceani]MBW0108880.1 (2Fe-2S)-binding protein [Pseudonocardia oceani]MBW0122678.1 (2Fe-2S)-binding protein [Pseudonocardia oceani]MBW0129286.1 (2Fe-2S)-binding protein [Pseudonocardia oceani]
MSDKQSVSVTINGHVYTEDCEPRLTLADFIRHRCGLTGTHLGCEHGVCGACTIMVDGRTARACLMLAVQVDGATITTVEGLADGDTLNPLQEAFWNNHGLQCGFCTPGMLMCATELLESNPEPTAEQVREQLSGNLCRCTGYDSIVQSVLIAAENQRR